MRLTRSAMICFCVFSVLTSTVSAISYSSKGKPPGQSQDFRRVIVKLRNSDEYAKGGISLAPESALAELLITSNPVSVSQFTDG